jgi:RNA polymerase sigma factor (sigma-70 family)
MTDLSDHQLLDAFIRNDSEQAFSVLVQRHIGLVHSVARRHTADPQLAQDITQAVFLILARKARTLGRRTVLPGWLYQAARLTAANFRRAEIRRIHREQEAFMQSQSTESDPTAWQELSPHLDEAMAGLGAVERDALVLRYFENKSMAAVGDQLGLAQNTAQKRVSRALEKLRHAFRKRGLALTAAALATALSAHSVQAAPAGLALTISASAAQGTAAGASTLSLVKGVLNLMAWTKAKTALVTAGFILLAAGTTTPVIVHHYRQAQRFNSVHIRGQMRSYPGDNFSSIAADTTPVPIELWKQFTPKMQWRVEKPGRVAVMDGQTTVLYFKGDNTAFKLPQAAHDALDTYWIHDLAEFGHFLTNELATARAKGWRVETAAIWTNGLKQTVLTVEAKSGLPDSSNQKNHFLATSDRREVYRYDDRSQRLASVQIFLEAAAGETLVFASTAIDYNPAIDPARFHLDLPADVAWYQEPQITAGPDPYAKMTADQAARAFFQACSREDWDEAAKFYGVRVPDHAREYLGGMRLLKLGDAYASAPYPGRFVPYEIQLRPQEFNLRVANTNAAGRYVVMGQYDRNLQLQEEFVWTAPPAVLADTDPDAKLPPADVVKAYFQAINHADWSELAKFTTEADLAQTRRQIEEAQKAGEPFPEFAAGEAVWSAEHSSYFVKCHMKITKKFRMAIRNDNPARHWQVDGGI